MNETNEQPLIPSPAPEVADSPDLPDKTDSPDLSSTLSLFEQLRADATTAEEGDPDPTESLLSSRRPSAWDVR